MKKNRSNDPNVRALKLLYSFSPKYFKYSIANSFFDTFLPYYNIYMSAEIVTELAGNRDPMKLLILVILTVVGAHILSVLNNVMHHKCNLYRVELNNNEAAYYNDKTLSLDYSDLEEPKVRQLRRKIIESAWIDNHGKGLLMSSSLNLVDNVFAIILSLILCLEMFIKIFSVDFSVFSVLMSLGIAVLMISQTLYTKWSSKKSAVFSEEMSQFMINENRLSGEYYTYNKGKDIRIYNLKDFFKRIDEKKEADQFSMSKRVRKYWFLFSIPSKILQNIQNVLLYALVCAYAIAGAFGVGSIIKYVQAIGKLFNNISASFYFINNINSNTPFVEDYLAYFDIPRKMYQGTLPIEKRAFCDDGDYDYDIEFRDVSFKYPGSEEYALRHVNIRFKIGERLAVVGRNGSGKTTFIKLLSRLYDPTEGRILLNGVDIHKYDYDDYMRVFTVVFQDFRLFAFTLGQNVAAGLEFDKEFCEECLEKVGFKEKLRSLPDGTDTYLYKNFDKNGVEISGGEAQKIALARALYKNAPFIILDEPTAALDPIAEAGIYEQFNVIVGNKTAVYISHRLSSCRFCDRIAVFDKGSVVQIGVHDELVETEGSYKELWKAQAKYYERREDIPEDI